MATESSKRTGVRIYRAADSPGLGETDFGSRNDFDAQPELQDVVRPLVGAGGASGRLLVRQTPEEGGYSLLYLWFKPHFPLFRHRHESDCMYVVLSGTAIMGNQTLRAGDSFFVAARAPYSYTAGPEGVEVLEIRHDVESFTTIFATNPESRLEDARRAVADNAGSWKDMTVGPLFRANAGNGADAGDAASA
jgi:mannose-6-phosphate isomerase-like protein (cupin superfamily)